VVKTPMYPDFVATL